MNTSVQKSHVKGGLFMMVVFLVGALFSFHFMLMDFSGEMLGAFVGNIAGLVFMFVGVLQNLVD